MPSDSSINRRQFFGASTAGAGAAINGAAQSRAKRPNVIVFYTDQQRWDTLGVNGCPMGLTPNLDRMAQRSVRFDRAFTSQPVCAPARSTIQTGKYPTATGVIHNGLALKDDERTMAHYFREANYQTGYIGKWHLGGTRSAPVPLERRGGYDQWWTASDAIEMTSGAFSGKVFDAKNQPIEFNKYRVDFLTDLAADFIEQKKKDPFYLFISYLEPHHQNDQNRFIAPEGYADRYKNNFHIPPDLAPYPGDWKSQLPDYYGIIARIDEQFGRLMKQLEDSNLLDNTIVAFTTDHGCHFRTRNPEYKRSCHDSSIRIPMMIQGPGFEPGRIVSEMVNVVDLAPTLIEAAGLTPRPDIQGRSMVKLAAGKEKDWTNEIMVQMREEALQRAIRTERWKYCIFDPESKRDNPHSTQYTERYLYDLYADPCEHVNLIGRQSYRKIANDLQERLIARMVKAGEPKPKVTPARYYA